MISRRKMLAGLGAGVAVYGFDGATRRWVAEAQAGGSHGHGHGHGHGHHDEFDHVPHLDGELVLDESVRAQFGHDLGFADFSLPRAVLRPGSIRDVKKMVKFCRRHRIQVAARGQGHSTNGQSQVDAGLIVDMSYLSTIHEIGSGHVVVDAGATWRMLLESTLLEGQTPPVLTGFIGLSIGGTLSMGGISGMAYDIGVQLQHVHELVVVTGKGQVKRCSEHRNRALFEAVLGGVGQYGIIVQAKLKLVPAEERALDYTLNYTDPNVFFDDLRTLMYRGEFDMVWGGASPNGSGGWIYQIFTTAFYTPPDVPDTAFMLRDLSYDPSSNGEIDGTYLEYQTRVDGLIDFLRSIGAFDGFMHPWFDVFLPESKFVDYVDPVLNSLAPDDVGMFGFVLFFPMFRSTVNRPLFRLPDEEIVILFDILTAADFPGFDADYAERMRQRNRTLYESARAIGATRYPIGSLDFTHNDWRQHYGAEWFRVLASKSAFDPDHILAPGVGIFPN